MATIVHTHTHARRVRIFSLFLALEQSSTVDVEGSEREEKRTDAGSYFLLRTYILTTAAMTAAVGDANVRGKRKKKREKKRE